MRLHQLALHAACAALAFTFVSDAPAVAQGDLLIVRCGQLLADPAHIIGAELRHCAERATAAERSGWDQVCFQALGMLYSGWLDAGQYMAEECARRVAVDPDAAARAAMTRELADAVTVARERQRATSEAFCVTDAHQHGIVLGRRRGGDIDWTGRVLDAQDTSAEPPPSTTPTPIVPLGGRFPPGVRTPFSGVPDLQP